jgi:hypothetical protein
MESVKKWFISHIFDLSETPRRLLDSELKGNFPLQSLCPRAGGRTLLNFLCSCLSCAFFVRLNARRHAMKVELRSTFLACPRN